MVRKIIESPATVRALVLTSMFPPHGYGGDELSCSDIVEASHHRRREAGVLTRRVTVKGALDADAEAVPQATAGDEHCVRRQVDVPATGHVAASIMPPVVEQPTDHVLKVVVRT